MADDKEKPAPAPEAPPVKPKPTTAEVPAPGRPHMIADSDDTHKREKKRHDE